MKENYLLLNLKKLKEKEKRKLKRYDDAKRDGDHVYAVIKGEAVNHNATTKCITSFNQSAQEKVIEEGYQKYNLNPADIDYLEASAAGAPVGDAIEANAIINVFEKYTDKKNYCAVSTIKSLIGHTTMASGIAGIIHVIKAMEHEQLPYIHNLKNLNTQIKTPSPIYVNNSLKKWNQPDGRKRMAAINSFGAGGTNCHVVLEEGDKVEKTEMNGCYLFPLSANAKETLVELTENMYAWLAENSEKYAMKNLSFTLTSGRKHFKYRKCFVAETKEELCGLLKNVLNNKEDYKNSMTYVMENNMGMELLQSKHQSTSALDGVERRKKLKKAASLYESGLIIDWNMLFAGEKASRISVPIYPFLRNSLWVSNRYQKVASMEVPEDSNRLSPLVHRNISTLKEFKFETVLEKENPLLADHKIQNKAILPGVCYLEMAVVSCEHLLGESITEVDDIFWSRSIEVEEPKKVYVTVEQEDDFLFYQIVSYEGSKKIVHNRGKVMKAQKENQSIRMDFTSLQKTGKRMERGEEYYEKYAKRGLYFGKVFRSIQNLYIGQNEVFSEIKLVDENSSGYNGYRLAPSILDSVMETVASLVDNIQNDDKIYMPYSLQKLLIYKPLDKKEYISIKKNPTEESLVFDVLIISLDGDVLLEMKGLKLTANDAGYVIEDAINVKEPIEECNNTEEEEVLNLLRKLKEKKITVENAEVYMEETFNG